MISTAKSASESFGPIETFIGYVYVFPGCTSAVILGFVTLSDDTGGIMTIQRIMIEITIGTIVDRKADFLI
jgi:hypothetical protein